MQQMTPQNQMAAPPVLHPINDQAALEEYARVKEDLRSGGMAGFLNVPGPNGETNWDHVRPGQEGSVLVHICGPWAAGKDYKVMQTSHFYKSAAHPQGASVSHGENCRFCAALNAAPKDQQERLKPWKRVKTRYLYNVCWLENLAAHHQNGQPQALIMAASKTLHTHLGNLFGEAGGVSQVVDYQIGRPVRIIKRKTGPQSFDIEWAAVPSFQQQPLPQEFWPVAANLVDLEKFVKESTDAEIDAALAELGVAPIPVAQSYHPGAQPPQPNPYEVQNFTAQQPIQQQPPQNFMVPNQMPMQQMATMAPPSMPAPPPVTSSATGPSQYQPQPSQQQVAASPVQPQQAQVQQVAVQDPDTPRALTYPLAPDVRLPQDRQRCFGSFSGADMWCQQCPEWLKSQCLTLSGQLAQQQKDQQQGAQLAALQNQLAGG